MIECTFNAGCLCNSVNTQQQLNDFCSANNCSGCSDKLSRCEASAPAPPPAPAPAPPPAPAPAPPPAP
eukprot:CAMPEP_0177628436 /NCGR_PEP_ID=MMETSP0447-20121125/132_1 /TAXON_ID=0 /ORGANISM="Stygamoeba regulata, Strain BSH-02190019" /LENGTH=67 /DNA_ID=CAMNT_0019129687 /DNA_START=172 /DNA_END=371 /DNA_ORIENTATION=+